MKVRLVSYLLKFFNWSLNCHDSRNVNFFIHINSNVIDTNLLVFPLFLPRSHNVVAYEKFIKYLFWTRRLYLINIELSKHCHLFPWYIKKKPIVLSKALLCFQWRPVITALFDVKPQSIIELRQSSSDWSTNDILKTISVVFSM